jgi:hypothetical protein
MGRPATKKNPPQPNFPRYVVEMLLRAIAACTLKVFRGADLQRLLQRAKGYRYCGAPWPVAAYDSAPTTVPPERVRPGCTDRLANGSEDQKREGHRPFSRSRMCPRKSRLSAPDEILGASRFNRM